MPKEYNIRANLEMMRLSLFAVMIGVTLSSNDVMAQSAVSPAEDARCIASNKKFQEDIPLHPKLHHEHNTPAHPIDGRDAEDFYYGLSGPVDYKNSMKIADQDGPGYILAMLYANGYGTRRDLDRSRYYICHSGLSNVTRMLDKIQTIEQTGKGQLDACDYAAGMAFLAFCSEVERRSHDRSRELLIKQIASSWNNDARKALVNLRRRADEFFSAKAEAAEGGDDDGTGQGSFIEYDLDSFEQDFVKELQWFSHFVPTGKDFLLYQSTEDRRLNSAYNACLKILEKRSDTVKVREMKESERRWIRYRDAWTALYEAVWKGRYESGKIQDFAEYHQSRKRALFLEDRANCIGNIWHH